MEPGGGRAIKGQMCSPSRLSPSAWLPSVVAPAGVTTSLFGEQASECAGGQVMVCGPQRMMLNSSKKKALSHPVIGSLSIVSRDMVPTCLPSHPLPGTVQSPHCMAVASDEDTERNKQSPARLLAARALHFLCSHFKIIRAALGSIRVS